MPWIVSVTLKVSEFTLLLWFLETLLIALARLVKRAREFVNVLQQTGVTHILRMAVPSRRSFSRAFLIGLTSSVMVLLLILVSLIFSRLPSAVSVSLTAILAVYLVIATVQNRRNLFDKGFGFIVGGTVALSGFLLLGLMLRQHGGLEGLSRFLERIVNGQ